MESADRPGGTWRNNIYPGSGCDTQSHHYCFSFEPNPNWSRLFARQPEILEYLKHCILTYELAENIVYGQTVTNCRFDDKTGGWLVETAVGNTYQGIILISAVGQLNTPNMPDFPGLELFKGAFFHTARWDNNFDLRGKRVAVVGSGATALQLIPPLVEEVKHLAVFQRSPNWIVPKDDRVYTEREKYRFRHNRIVERFNRYKIYWNWEKTWPEFILNSRRSRKRKTELTQAIADQVADPELAAKLTPDFPVGCRRILISDDYYTAIQSDNVELIDDPIASFYSDGIRTQSGRAVAVDVVIMATGFKAHNFLSAITLTGVGAKDLKTAWQDGAAAYLGIAIPDFPNLFMLYGPNTNLGHNSILFMIERQVEYIMACINHIIGRQLHSMSVKPEALHRYNQQLQRELAKTVWAGGCSSWYKNEAGKIVNNWSTTTIKYCWRTLRPKLRDYERRRSEKYVASDK